MVLHNILRLLKWSLTGPDQKSVSDPELVHMLQDLFSTALPIFFLSQKYDRRKTYFSESPLVTGERVHVQNVFQAKISLTAYMRHYIM